MATLSAIWLILACSWLPASTHTCVHRHMFVVQQHTHQALILLAWLCKIWIIILCICYNPPTLCHSNNQLNWEAIPSCFRQLKWGTLHRPRRLLEPTSIEQFVWYPAELLTITTSAHLRGSELTSPPQSALPVCSARRPPSHNKRWLLRNTQWRRSNLHMSKRNYPFQAKSVNRWREVRPPAVLAAATRNPVCQLDSIRFCGFALEKKESDSFDHIEQSSDSKGSVYVHTSGGQYSGFQLLTHRTTFCLHFSPAQVCRFGAACAQLCISVLPWIQVGLMQAVFKYHFLKDFETALFLQRFLNCSVATS